jgi:hypothetical protein
MQRRCRFYYAVKQLKRPRNLLYINRIHRPTEGMPYLYSVHPALDYGNNPTGYVPERLRREFEREWRPYPANACSKK